MRNRHILLITLALLALTLAACAPPAATEVPPAEEPAADEPAASTDVPPTNLPPTDEPAAESSSVEEPAPAAEALPADPQTVEFTTGDGVSLSGTFFPAAEPSAPVVVLMHWAPGSQEDWFAAGKGWPQLALILQNRDTTAALPGRPASYNVLTFNFRGYPPSGGNRDHGQMYQDALAAVAFAKTLDGVDPDRVLTVGASIGSDGAVDGCAGGACLAAISLSPGSYIGVPYTQAVIDVGEATPVLCVAAQGDGPSPSTCVDAQDAVPDRVETRIYEGSAHGMAMFGSEGESDLLTRILDFLDEAVASAG